MSKRVKNNRRATVLILVVSLLALLFVLVTGFISIARVDRQTIATVSEAEVTDQILDALDNQLELLVADQITSDDGSVLTGDSRSYAAEDIPGYRKSNYLASLEPVWKGGVIPSPQLASGTWGLVERLVWPAVSSLDPTVETPVARPLLRLMPENDRDNDTRFMPDDIVRYARNPILDADGDGVPDASFVLSGPATEIANQIAGVSVNVPPYDKNNPFDISGIPAPNVAPLYGYEKWRQFRDNARYLAAVRVVSHGGMLALDAPALYMTNGTPVMPFNRDFVVSFFDAVRNRYDRALPALYPDGSVQQNRLFADIRTSVSAIETQLRRRFLLPPRAELENHRAVRRSAPILAELQGELMGSTGFPKTFIPSFRSGLELFGTPRNWQRINIGTQGGSNDDERLGWAQAASLDATAYDTLTGTALSQLKHRYDRRHLLTAINNSDDLARKQTPGDPEPSTTSPLDLDTTGQRGSTYEGELKFYLGEVGKAFLATGGGLDYEYSHERGRPIIEHLARLYFDMLAGHSANLTTTTDDWDSVFSSSSSNKEAVSRRQQALMLAVNTVAFAAPRDPANGARQEGSIDVVYYDDGGVEYVGYTPQPFFSEAIAYATPDDPNDPNDDHARDNTEVAIELYNPNDPYFVDPGTGTLQDAYALPLAQFAISTNDVNPNNDPNAAGGGWKRLNFAFPNDYIAGRSFKTFIVQNTGQNPNDYFQNQNSAWPLLKLDIEPQSNGGTQGTQVTLWLWRQAANGHWVPVDRFDVRIPVPRTGSTWRAVHRDTSPARVFGLADLDHNGSIDPNPAPNGEDTDGDAVADTYARWNVATAVAQSTSGNGAPITQSLDSPKWLGNSGPGMLVDPDAALGTQFAPTTPLITMNAGPVGTFGPNGEIFEALRTLPMFGNPYDLRPRSFPTVGFLLFVPRFSHVWKPGVTQNVKNSWKPLPWVLRRQWSGKSYSVSTYPADFGHMPVFDNKQSAPAGSYFHATTGVGKIPWGLLVFDYFTTINPVADRNGDGAPDIDPIRIPGRININAAPWYLLANLPMLGPDPDRAGELPLRVNPGGNLTLSDPYPSFWDPGANMLVDSYAAGAMGVNPITGTPHYRLLIDNPTYDHTGQALPWVAPDDSGGRWRLGPWLAQSAAAYRDGVQYVDFLPAQPSRVFAYSQLRNAANGAVLSSTGGLVPFSAPYRNPGVYGAATSDIRGTPATAQAKRPTEFGFVTVGELLNVKGFDSTPPDLLPPLGNMNVTTLAVGDYVKAVSLLALLDTQYLTTRSNTFTIYTSVIDRENPQKSMRSQITIDRTNLLPRLDYAFFDAVAGTYYPVSDPANLQNPAIRALPLVPMLLDMYAGAVPGHDGIPETPVRTQPTDRFPQVIASQRVGYFDARNDD